MADEVAVPIAPVEAPDPFKGGEPSFEEYSKYRKDGEIPERFKPEEKKPETEAPAAPKTGETEEGKEPSIEQEKKERERDEQGKFKAPEKEPLFNAEQQKAFDRAFSKREAKVRREFEDRYAAKTSVPQGTAPVKTQENAAPTEPQRPEPPKLSTYKGTVEEYDKELADFPAKLQAFLDAQHAHQDKMNALQKRLVESEQKTMKAHPEYEDEVKSLTDDIKNREEPLMPQYVIDAIAQEAEDPYALTLYLAQNREEFRRLTALSPERTLREVLKLDVKLSNAPAPTKEPAAAKPKPPEPVGARASSSAFDVSDENTDPEVWARERNKQVFARRNR